MRVHELNSVLEDYSALGSVLYIERPLVEGINDKNIFKAVFMAGGPGSGKSFISDMLIGRGKGPVSGLGAVVVNSDHIFEKKLMQAGLPSVMSDDPEEYAKQMDIRAAAKAITDSRMKYWLDGMLPLVIDGTGKNFSKIAKKANALRSMGYDVSMVFVNTSLEVALERNAERPRQVKPELVKEMWQGVQKNMGKFQSFFGSANYKIIDNSKSLDDRGIESMKKKLFNIGSGLLEKPLKNRTGKAVINQMQIAKVKTLSELVAYHEKKRTKKS